MVEALKREAAAQGLIRADGLYRVLRGARRRRHARALRRAGARSRASTSRASRTASGSASPTTCASDAASDYVALFAVTCGAGVRARARGAGRSDGRLPPVARAAGARHRVRGGLRRDAARAAAHAVGLPGSRRASPIADKLKARYRGLRVSFGYPACPELADQAHALRRLLRPGADRRLSLTEGFMMDPGGLRLGPRLPPPGGEVLQGRAEPGASRGGEATAGRSMNVAPTGISPRFLALLDAEDLDAQARPRSSAAAAGRLSLLLARRAHHGRRARSRSGADPRWPRARRGGRALPMSSSTRPTSSARNTAGGSPTSSPRTCAPRTPSSSGRPARCRPDAASPWWPSTWTSGGRRARSRASPTTRRACDAALGRAGLALEVLEVEREVQHLRLRGGRPRRGGGPAGPLEERRALVPLYRVSRRRADAR